MSDEPFQYLGRLENAGEILLGEHTPPTLGNFVIGVNHVLPTGGWARTGSPLDRLRLHEADLGGLCHRQGLSGAGAPCPT